MSNGVLVNEGGWDGQKVLGWDQARYDAIPTDKACPDPVENKPREVPACSPWQFRSLSWEGGYWTAIVYDPRNGNSLSAMGNTRGDCVAQAVRLIAELEML